MDFHGMKRKELQALCKKHGVPANLTNREMADRLASVFKENEDPVSLETLSTNLEEIGSRNEAKVVKKPLKKVRFSPDNQTFEYEVSVNQWPRTRSRKQMLSKNPAQVIENAPNSEDISEVEGCQVRVTRSGVQNAVEDDINMGFSPPVGRKRGRGGKRYKDAEMTNMGNSEVLELGQREDVKNGCDKVTAGLSGRQLRSSKNVTQVDSKKIRNGKGGDEVHLFVESIFEDVKSKNGPKRLTRNATKEDVSVAMSSEVEKVEPRVRRLSRAKSKDVASMVKNEVKIVGVKGGCEDDVQLKQTQKGRGINGLSQNAVPQRTNAESSLLAVGGAEAEKPLRRSKRNSKKGCAKSTTSMKSETQVTKGLEQSESVIALVEHAECLRRYSSRRKSVVSQSGNWGNKEEFLKKETGKRSRATELDAIVEHSTSQHQAPLRRSRRKTVVLNAPALTDAEFANKEDIGKMEQLRAPLRGNDMTEELPRKSSQNCSRYGSSRTSKEDQIAVAKNDNGVEQLMKEPILEEEKTSALEHHPIIEKPQRRSNLITSISASVAPPKPIAKAVEKKQQSKSWKAIIQEEAALTESLPAPGELPAGKDNLVVVSEEAENKNNLDLNVGKQAVKNAEACSNRRRKGLRGNSGEKKQCGFAEASPLFLDVEDCEDSSGNMEENLIETSVKLVRPSTDQEMKQSSHKSVAVCEKESNLVADGGNVESEVNSQSLNTTCVFDDANCPDPEGPKFESDGSHVVDSSEITFPAESRARAEAAVAGNGVSDKETKEDIRLIDTYAAHESLVVYKEDRTLVESDKEMLVQVELESNVVNMETSEITSIAKGLSLADQRDLTGAASTLLQSEKELGTELPGGENTNLASDSVNADDSNVTAAESVEEEVFNLNEFGESNGLKSELENSLKKAEEMIGTDFSNREGIPHIASSVEATENQESSAQFHFATAETDAQKEFEIQQSIYSNNAAPETPCGPTPVEDKTCRAEVVDTAGSGMSNQGRSEDLNPGNAHCIHESVLIYGDNTGLVNNDEQIRVHDVNFEGDSCRSLNRTGDVDDSNLAESRMVDFEGNGSKVFCLEISSLTDVFSSANQVDHAGKTSSNIELEKVLQTEQPSENMNSINCNMDAEGISTPVAEDHIKGQLEDANATVADSVEEVIFKDLLNELGESIGLKRGTEIPLKISEKLSATKLSDGEGITLTESYVKAEKQEYRAEIDVVAAITGASNSTETKCSSGSDSATCETPFGPASQSQALQDKLCSAGITVSIAGSEKSNQDVETSLVEDDKEILLQDDNIEGEIKYQPCLSLNKTGASDNALVAFASNADKVVCSGKTSLDDVYSPANQMNFADETSNELRLLKVLDLEESSRGEHVHRSDRIEVEDDIRPAQEDQSSTHLEDANITAAEPVQEVVFWDHFNKFCESCATKEFEVSLRKVEETGTNDSPGKGMVQTGSLVEINEMSEATSQKTIMAMQQSMSSHDKDLISPLRPQVGSQDVRGTIYTVETAVSYEENVKIVENEHQETINTGKKLFFSGKKIVDESSEGKFRADGVCDPLSESIDSQCAKDKNLDISDRSFSNASGETQEKHICEILDGEGTDLVSLEEKGICNEKLPFNGCLPVSNDMQEKSEVVCMDKKNMRNEIPANILSQLELEQLDNELTEHTSEPFSKRHLDPALVYAERNASGERVMDLPFIEDFAATKDHNGTSVSKETDVEQEDNIMEKIAISALKVEIADNRGGNVDAELYDTNMSDTETIFPETDIFWGVTTGYPEEISNAPASVGTENYDDLNDQGDEVGIERDCSSSLGLDGLMSTVGVKVANISEVGTLESTLLNAPASVGTENFDDLDDQGDEIGLERDCSSSFGLDGLISTVGTLESTLNCNDPQSGTKVDDPDVNNSDAAKQFDITFTIEEAGVKDGGKTLVSHQRSLLGGKQEDVTSYAAGKEERRQAMDDINDAGGTEISIDCKVTIEERDGCQINTGGFSDVTDGSFVERSKVDLEEIAEAKSDDCERSMKTATALDSTDNSVVNQPPYLNERKSCDLETEEPHALHLPENIAGGSREVGSCSKLDIVSSVKPKMVVDCSPVSSICATSDEHKHLENPDESNILTNLDMSLFFGNEDEVKKTDAKAGDSNDVALDKAITECNSSDIKKDYVARSDFGDTNFSVKKDGPEDIEETMELRKDFSGLDAAATADKSPLLKNSEVGRVEGSEEAFRTELNLLNASAKKEGSNSVSVKQLISSIMKSKSKSGLIQRTPKRAMILHDMKENEGRPTSSKRKQIGNMTTPKPSSKRRPLERI